MAKRKVKVGRNSLSQEQITSILERVERLNEEMAGIKEDVREIFAEAKSNGYDQKILRQLVKLRAEDPTKRSEHNQMLGIYAELVGIDPFS
jgi:uncharacterized protein (UPF0335 family)